MPELVTSVLSKSRSLSRNKSLSAYMDNIKESLKRVVCSENSIGWLFIIPAFSIILLFWIFPILYSMFLSFFEWDMISARQFIGIENYQFLLEDADFMKTCLNTGIYSLSYVLGVVLLGILLALLVNTKLKGAGFFRVIIFSPQIAPMVAISIIWMALYDVDEGLFNGLLNLIGLPSLGWLASTDTVLPALIIMGVWKAVGYYMMFFLAALQSVPDSIYEAGKIDGANQWQLFKSITIPSISPTIFFVTVVSLIEGMQVFDQISVLTQGGPSNASMVIVYYLYKSAFKFFNVGYASAIGMVLFALLIILTVIQFMGSKKWVND